MTITTILLLLWSKHATPSMFLPTDFNIYN